MVSKLDVLGLLAASEEATLRVTAEHDRLTELMASPEYLRHSSAVINEALKDGFDVLQLPNGDIVTTGTRVVVHNFTWDAAKKKLVKLRAGNEKSAARGAGQAAVAEAAE